MISCAALALLAASAQAAWFSAPFQAAEPNRLAWTPVLDGVISEEEWDVLATGENWLGAFQWEPGHLYVGGKFPDGLDVIASFDLGNNGWLVGKDNYEFRFSRVADKVVVKARMLDATSKEGPRWVEIPGFEMASRAATTPVEGGWALEASLADPNTGRFPVKAGTRIGVRYDLVPAGTVIAEPFLPRPVAPVRLVTDRSLALPPGLAFRADESGRSVVPGEATRVRFLFNRTEKVSVQELSIRAEGPLRDQAAKLTTPFPAFDSKNRSFVDYATMISPAASTGYRVLRGSLGLGDGPPAFVQASLRIAPLIELSLTQLDLPVRENPQTKRFPFHIQSNSDLRVDGQVKFQVPAGWKIGPKSETQKFTIYASRGRIRKVLELTVPGNSKGAFPIQATISVGGKTLDQTLWLNF
jgi:hypothetical protein